MKRRYSKVIKKIAAQEGVSEEIIYSEMQKAITEGYNNPDPAVQAQWRKIVPDGTVPSPEKLIKMLANEIKSDNKK